MEKVAPYDCTIGLLSLLAGTESEQEKVRSEVLLLCPRYYSIGVVDADFWSVNATNCDMEEMH